MTRSMTATCKAVLAGTALVALGACSSQQEGGATGFDIARQAASQIMQRGGSAETGAAADTPEAMASRALAANPAPLILVGFESLQTTQVLAQVGVNRDMRTYMTPNKEAVILRNGLLAGTRGLGNDLSVSEPGAMASLIRTRRAGQGTKTMRYIDGEWVERPLPLQCTTRTGENQNFSFAGRSWNALQLHETCRGSGVEVENSYLVTADGQIPVSRQWVGPKLGYVTVQVIRP